jgi:phage host-nuclease inhibitor protein Gam
MTKKPTRTKAAAIAAPVPQSREEAAQVVRRVGEIRRDLARLEADMNDRVAGIKASYEAGANVLRAELEREMTGLQTWCEANRAALTEGGRVKSADLGTGVVGWRLRPPSVRIVSAERIIDMMKTLGLARYVRVKEEVDREAILREPEPVKGIPGIHIGSAGEHFVVEPAELKLAETAPAAGGGA